MQVGVDVKCMQTKFGGRSLFDFGDFAHFCLRLNLAKISLSDHRRETSDSYRIHLHVLLFLHSSLSLLLPYSAKFLRAVNFTDFTASLQKIKNYFREN